MSSSIVYDKYCQVDNLIQEYSMESIDLIVTDDSCEMNVNGDRVAKINDFVESSLVSNVSKVHLDKSRDTYTPVRSHSLTICRRPVTRYQQRVISFVSFGRK